ncbi:sentrin-specific protease 7 [Scomber scombrus]|uniref:Sentrin-specific protease 7 n=1 Tax=Scomber scombrus TaxID=13677 RepID=A0AAV1NIY0_SCOSC
MTERRRALTLPFNVDKDKLMENPLRIPMTCLSSDCGRFERQVPWTTIAGCKLRHSSQQKNVSMLFEHNHAVMYGMANRKPCLILTDVLKTEPGKVYMERIKRNPSLGNGEQVASTRKDSGRCREESLIRRETRSAQRETRNDENKTMTPKCNQKTPPLSAKRSRIRRRLQTADNDEDTEESKDIDEVIIGKENGEDYKFAEVVDCGLSVSWEPAEDNGSCDEFSPNSIKDRWTDPANEVQQSLKRKIRDTGSQCNGTGSPKRHRESVLRLTGEDGRKGGPAQARICFEESGEDLDLESLDRSIVQFTVGADERTDVLLPIINPNLEVTDVIGTPRRSRSSSQDDTTKTSPTEPIVLSSDDEESSDVSRRCRPAVQTLVSLEGTVIRGQSSQEAVAKQQEDSDMQDMQLLRVVLEDVPDSVPVSHIPTEDHSIMSVAFSSLHCGGYRGKANGDIMIADQKIIIPLKDTSEQVEVMLALEREELRRYSVWEQEELEDRGLHCEGEELPPAVLLFCVSETAAAAIQWDLRKLCVQQDGTTDTGKSSPFILLTLRDPLKGMEGALFRSLLDIDCLKNLGHETFYSFVIHNIDGASDLEDIHSPTLSLDDSLELIRRTGLDPHLLSLFGLENTDPGTNTDQDSAYSDRDSTASPHIELEVESQKETELELETAPEEDTGMQPKPDEDQKEQELEHPPEKSRKEPTPDYTLCHRRTKGSYSVSLCKADSSWTKYKHQGLARRLIQFPPPPLKGGITVTMEDLQCLDNGQFLNDVIIDFYLKYLLQNASDAVVERSHIFSSFFYKQLTRRDNASEGGTSDSCQRQRRHQRVKTWTRHVDIFKKDFLFVPVNQEAHWYLVVICFPGLEEPTFEAWTGPDSTGNSHSGTSKLQDQEEAQGSKCSNDKTETTSNRNDNLDTGTENTQDSTKETLPGPVSCTERTYKKNTVCKRPCILIMDSLRLSFHERVFKLLREYLQSEWEARRGSSRDFSPDQMKSSYCKVPLQDNSSDCGLYLLQYVESFLKDPVVHFDLPLHLEHWFPRQQVRRKRDQIRDLVLNLYRHQNLDNNR